MNTYKCFRCGYEHEVYGDPDDPVSRKCPSCGADHATFTFEEMGDILNNFYIHGDDLELFDLEEYDS